MVRERDSGNENDETQGTWNPERRGFYKSLFEKVAVTFSQKFATRARLSKPNTIEVQINAIPETPKHTHTNAPRH